MTKERLDNIIENVGAILLITALAFAIVLCILENIAQAIQNTLNIMGKPLNAVMTAPSHISRKTTIPLLNFL